MSSSLAHSAFIAYAVACIVLCANLLLLWVTSGVARGKTKTTLNPEDAKAFGTQLVAEDPPEVARVLRAHQNAQASIFPFLILGAVYVLAGGNATVAIVLFAVFCVARWLHTLVYLKALQPWRTAAFLAGLLCTVGLMVAIVVALV